MRNRRFRVFTILFAFGLVAAACGDSDSADTTTPTTSAPAATTTTAADVTTTPTTSAPAATTTTAADVTTTTAPPGPIVLAVTVPLSGPVAQFGIGVVNGATLAAETFNAAGGIDGREVELVFLDTECNPTVSASVAADVASRADIFAVVGDLCSADVIAMLPIMDEAGITMVSPGASSPAITDLIMDEGYEGWIRTAPRDITQGRQMVKLATEVLGLSNLAVLYATDDYGQGLNGAIEETAASAGATIVASETFIPEQTTDFTPQLTNIAAADPEAILLVGFFNDLGAATFQMPRAGLDVPIIASAGAHAPDFAPLAGDPGEGAYVLGLYDPAAFTAPANLELVNLYTDRFDIAPDFNAVTTWLAMNLIKTSVEDLGATRDNLGLVARSAVMEDTAVGQLSFTEFGDTNTGMLAVFRVEGGVEVPSPELTAELIN